MISAVAGGRQGDAWASQHRTNLALHESERKHKLAEYEKEFEREHELYGAMPGEQEDLPGAPHLTPRGGTPVGAGPAHTPVSLKKIELETPPTSLGDSGELSPAGNNLESVSKAWHVTSDYASANKQLLSSETGKRIKAMSQFEKKMHDHKSNLQETSFEKTNRRRIVSMRVIGLCGHLAALVSVFCNESYSFTDTERGWARLNTQAARRNMKIIISLFTALEIAALYSYGKVLYQVQQHKGLAPLHLPFLQSRAGSWCILECVFCFLRPSILTAFGLGEYEVEQASMGVTLVYKLDTLLTGLAVLHLPLLLPRMFHEETRRAFKVETIATIYHVDVSIWFSCKLAIYYYPLSLMLGGATYVVFIFGYLTHIAEQPGPKGDDFYYLFDSLWLALATLSTVGYGDISPGTHFGRLFAVLTFILGNFIMALIFTIMNARVAMTPTQQKMLEFHEAAQLRSAHKGAAAEAVAASLRFSYAKARLRLIAAKKAEQRAKGEVQGAEGCCCASDQDVTAAERFAKKTYIDLLTKVGTAKTARTAVKNQEVTGIGMIVSNMDFKLDFLQYYVSRIWESENFTGKVLRADKRREKERVRSARKQAQAQEEAAESAHSSPEKSDPLHYGHTVPATAPTGAVAGGVDQRQLDELSRSVATVASVLERVDHRMSFLENAVTQRVVSLEDKLGSTMVSFAGSQERLELQMQAVAELARGLRHQQQTMHRQLQEQHLAFDRHASDLQKFEGTINSLKPATAPMAGSDFWAESHWSMRGETPQLETPDHASDDGKDKWGEYVQNGNGK